jgi:hypothetical protein
MVSLWRRCTLTQLHATRTSEPRLQNELHTFFKGTASTCLQLLDDRELEGRWRDVLRRQNFSPLLWGRYFAFLASQGPSLSLETLRTCCIDATLALASHSAALSSSRKPVDDETVAAAECAVVDAAMRHVTLEVAMGEVDAAFGLLQGAIEWAAFPSALLGACCPTPPSAALRWTLA